MKKDMRDALIIFGIVLFALLSCVYYIESIDREVTIMVTKVIKFPNRIFIYSFESSMVFTRFPYGKSLDQLYITEVGKSYIINYTGFKVISIEVLK